MANNQSAAAAAVPGLRVTDRAIREVIVIGGGLAGLAAATTLAEKKFRVRVLERRPYVGGRASSYEHPGTGEIIDNCQHLLLGCCTNLRDFYKRIGADDKIQWTNRITMVEPGGRRSVLRPGLFPPPFHSAVSFLTAPMLSLEDKLAVGKAMMALAQHLPADDGENFQDWLTRHRQTARAIDHIWRPVIVSALNDDLDRVSSRYAADVFRKSFLNSAAGGYVGLASVPLGEIYSRAVDFLRERNSEVTLRATAERFRYDPAERVWRVQTLDNEFTADALVFAVPFDALRKLMPAIPGGEPQALETLSYNLDQFETSPITGIHLWLDRKITDLPHAALLDSPIQWLFQKSKLQPATRASTKGSYVELVVSASRDMVGMARQEIIDLAMQELPQFFPAALGAGVVKAAVVKEVHATFSVTPGLDAARPGAISPWPRTFLAGDWTATGWPSTMESAVRSGYLAAEALCSVAGRQCKVLVPDLPAKGLMRWADRKAQNERETYG